MTICYTIFNKSFLQCPPRIKRFLFRLFKYDFEFQYTPGGDTLSRALLANDFECPDKEIIHYVSTVINLIPISERKRSEIQAETNCDSILKKVVEYLKNGWPQKRDVDREVAAFYPYCLS